MAEQAAALLHTSNLYFHPLQGQVAERLSTLSGLQRTFFCNSGTEAMEACLKFARRYWFTQGVRGRTHYVAFEHGFSGRSMGALSVTANPHYREPFEPLIPGVTFVSPDDVAALDAAVSSATAAIVVEPIQGEGGVRPIPPAMAEAIERACARTGALLIADEVQCGLGRTGAPFYFQTLGLTPDLVTVGKALGGGVPVGAALVSEAGRGAGAARRSRHHLRRQPAGDARRAGRARRADGPRPAGARGRGRRLLRDEAARAGRDAPVIAEVRGAGLMRGLELTRDAAPVVEGAMARGLLVNRTAERVVRMLPPYTVTTAEIDEAVATLDAVLAGLPARASAARQAIVIHASPPRSPRLTAASPRRRASAPPACTAASRPAASPTSRSSSATRRRRRRRLHDQPGAGRAGARVEGAPGGHARRGARRRHQQRLRQRLHRTAGPGRRARDGRAHGRGHAAARRTTCWSPPPASSA